MANLVLKSMSCCYISLFQTVGYIKTQTMQTYEYRYTQYSKAISNKSTITLQYQFVNIQLTSFQNNRTDAPIRSPIPTRIPIRLCPILSRNPAFLRYVTLVWLSMWWPGASGFYQNFKYKPQTYLFITVQLFYVIRYLCFVIYSDQ